MQKSISATLSKLGKPHIVGKPWPQRKWFHIALSIFEKNWNLQSPSELSFGTEVVHMWARQRGGFRLSNTKPWIAFFFSPPPPPHLSLMPAPAWIPPELTKLTVVFSCRVEAIYRSRLVIHDWHRILGMRYNVCLEKGSDQLIVYKGIDI